MDAASARAAFAELGPRWSVLDDPESGGCALAGRAAEPGCYVEMPLGRLAGLRRFTCGFRGRPFWMTPRVGVDESDAPVETQWLLAERDGGDYALVAPLLDGATRFSLRGGPDGLVVVGETGDPEIATDGGVCVYVATGADPYELLARAAKAVSRRVGVGRLRADKPAPDFVDLFGWCTWDAFYREVSQDDVRRGLESFAAGGVEPRLLILDDGWQSTVPGVSGELRLTSLSPNEKFGGDLSGLAELAKRDFQVQRLLVWHSIFGYWGGIDPYTLPEYGARIVARSFGPGILAADPAWNVKPWGSVIGLPAAEKIAAFYDDYHRLLASQGIDGVKVDVQAMLEAVSAGQGGRVALAKVYRAALEESVSRHFGGRLINCMSCSTEAAYLTADSTVMRTSDDFYPTKPETHGRHVFANAHTSLWFGEFVLPDWDMFQSGHEMGAFHAAARAVSGGPVYVSDKPGEHDFALLRSLVFSDGSVPRADLPGRPTRDCLMRDPLRESGALKIFNRNGERGVLGLFNCVYPEDGDVVARACPADVEGMDGERFAAYARRADTLWTGGLRDGEAFSIAPRDWEIVSYAPIQNGFAAIGLAELLNCGGAIRGVDWEGERGCRVSLRDGGTLLAWCEREPTSVAVEGRVAEWRFDAASGRLEVDIPADARRVDLSW